MLNAPRRLLGAYSAMYGADRQADERPRKHKHAHTRRDGRQDRTDRVDQRVHDQQRTAAEMVGQRTGNQRPGRCAQRCPGHEIAGGEGTQGERQDS
jgi:hypothetical protein